MVKHKKIATGLLAACAVLLATCDGAAKRPDGRTAWILTSMPLKALNDPGLSATEVCSLYMSRALLSAMPGAAFADGLSGLMRKIEKALAPRVRAFLDQLPGVVKVKPGAVKKHATNHGEVVARLQTEGRIVAMAGDGVSER